MKDNEVFALAIAAWRIKHLNNSNDSLYSCLNSALPTLFATAATAFQYAMLHDGDTSPLATHEPISDALFNRDNNFED